MATSVIDRHALDSLMALLIEKGYELIGPVARDGAIVYDHVEKTADLPEGLADEQDGGRYRLSERADTTLFGYNLGQSSWKQYLFPPTVELLRVRTSNGDLDFQATPPAKPRYAFFGVRACELAAIAIQDRVFMGGGPVDPSYASRRNGLLIVAVNCGQAAGTCFCASMGTGPRCTSGFDVVLTEVTGEDEPYYIAESGSSKGEELIEAVPGRPGTAEDEARVETIVQATASSMTRVMDTDGIRDLLVDNPDHERWDQVATRCLTCGNCTLACPTCFCSTTEDTVTLDGEAVRDRVWDSCFSLDFTSLHGHPVRGSTKSRYRQWMTHKLATWQDQFGTSGCVGCGRCITWCPVGIDITEEVAAMRETVTP